MFISAGNSFNPKYEAFVTALIDHLDTIGVDGRALERTDYPVNSPLQKISELLKECSGVIVVAYQRKFFASGTERPGTEKKRLIKNARFTTPWNQIEAAFAYQLGLPIFVIAETHFYREGLLEDSYNWPIVEMDISLESLNEKGLQRRIQEWCSSLNKVERSEMKIDHNMTIRDLVSALTLNTAWKVGGLLIGIMVISFSLGRYIPK